MIYISSSCIKKKNILDVLKVFRAHNINQVELSGGTENFPNKEKKLIDFLNGGNFEIRLKEGNKLIGQCGLNNISWINRSAEFSIIIGYSEFRGYGYGSDAIRILIKYGFEELNLMLILNHCL